jgi:hypothetical protein
MSVAIQKAVRARIAKSRRRILTVRQERVLLYFAEFASVKDGHA